MPLREGEAIVLRTYRLGEADKIVSLFTRPFGRLRAAAAGAQRARTRYGGTLEPLSYIRVWFYERENRDLVRINSTELVESFFDMQKDYRMQVAAQYVAEVAERFFPERQANDRAFRLLLGVLRAMKRSGELGAPLLYFDYWLLRLEGFLPDLTRCAACGRVLDEGGYYGPASEGLCCADCRTPTTPRAVAASALELAESARGVTPEQWLGTSKPAAVCAAARRFLEDLIEAHAEKKLVTRELLDAGV
jgi:DNA repair protein RecO (recombination protein O)